MLKNIKGNNETKNNNDNTSYTISPHVYGLNNNIGKIYTVSFNKLI